MSEPILIGILCLLGLLVFLLSGVWVAIGIGMVGALAFFIFTGGAGFTPYIPWTSTNSFPLAAIPLYILMGEFLLQSGISARLYRATSMWLSPVPGGLLHSNIVSCALFAAVSGSSAATAATIGTVAVPELEKRNYDSKLTMGSLAAGGTLGILIPPSLPLIVYGVISASSVGKLFMGGVIPGIILSVSFMIYIGIRVLANRGLAPVSEVFSLKAIIPSIVDVLPIIILAIIVLGGIFGGIVTPTEAAALGAAAALIMGLAFRRLTWQSFVESLSSTLRVSCMVLFILVGASILGGFLGMLGLPKALSTFATTSGLPREIILAAVFLVYVFLGCFMEGMSLLILTVPTVLPAIKAIGMDPIWFGVVVVLLIEVCLLTPPVGVNLYIIQGISKKSLGEVALGAAPFFLIILAILGVLTAFPSVVLWLPSLMK